MKVKCGDSSTPARLLHSIHYMKVKKKEAGFAFRELKILCVSQITVKKIPCCLCIKVNRSSSQLISGQSHPIFWPYICTTEKHRKLPTKEIKDDFYDCVKKKKKLHSNNNSILIYYGFFFFPVYPSVCVGKGNYICACERL